MADTKVAIQITGDSSSVQQAANAANKSLGELWKEADKFKKLDLFSHVATGVNQFTALIGQAARAVSGVISPLIDAGLAAEKIGRQLTFTAGSSSGAARELGFLRETTNKLGVDFNSAAGAYGKLAAASRGTVLEGKATREVFTAMSQASVVMGMSADETSGALLALQQMISKGSVQSEELRGQLGERLPGAFQIAARAMGVTTAELGKMLEAGLDIQDFLPKFTAELNKTFSGEAGSASASAQANINRMTNAWEDFKTSLANSGVLSAASNLLRILAAGMNSINTSDFHKLARLEGDLANAKLIRNGEAEMGEDTYYTDKRIENIQKEINAIRAKARAQQEAATAKAKADADAAAKAAAAVPGSAWDSSSRENRLAQQYNPDRIKVAEDKRIKDREEFNKKYRSKNEEMALELARVKTLFSGAELAEAENKIKEKYAGKMGKAPESIDVFNDKSFITHDKATAENIKASFDFENWAWGEIAKEREKAVQENEKAADAFKKSVDALYASTDAGKFDKIVSDMDAAMKSFNLGVEHGGINQDQLDAINSKLMETTDHLKDQNDIGKQLGMTFSSAFEDAVVGGKKLSEVMKGLEQDIIRIIMRKTVTEPLGNAISSLTKDFDWSSLIPKFATGTNYVPNDMLAYVHKGEAIVPAKYNSGSAGGVSVTVNNTAPGVTATPQVRENNGKLEIEVLVAQAISRDMARNGPITQSFGSLFGLGRTT